MYKALERVKEELTICSSTSVILRGRRIVVRQILQKKVIDLAHESHQGITKTRSLLREKVWFPGINNTCSREESEVLPCMSSDDPRNQMRATEHVTAARGTVATD